MLVEYLGHAGLVFVLATLALVSSAVPIGPAFDPHDTFEREDRARGRRAHQVGFVLRVVALMAVVTYAIAGGPWLAFPELDPTLRGFAYDAAGVAADVVFALSFAALAMTLGGHSRLDADRPARAGATAALLAVLAAGTLASMRWTSALGDGWLVALAGVLVLVPLALACLAHVALSMQPEGGARLLAVGALVGGWGACGLALFVLSMGSAGYVGDSAGAWLAAATLIVVTLAIGSCALLLTARTVAEGHRPWKRPAGWTWLAPVGMLAVERRVFGMSETLPGASILAQTVTAGISLFVLVLVIVAGCGAAGRRRRSAITCAVAQWRRRRWSTASPETTWRTTTSRSGRLPASGSRRSRSIRAISSSRSTSSATTRVRLSRPGSTLAESGAGDGRSSRTPTTSPMRSSTA